MCSILYIYIFKDIFFIKVFAILCYSKYSLQFSYESIHHLLLNKFLTYLFLCKGIWYSFLKLNKKSSLLIFLYFAPVLENLSRKLTENSSSFLKSSWISNLWKRGLTKSIESTTYFLFFFLQNISKEFYFSFV